MNELKYVIVTPKGFAKISSRAINFEHRRFPDNKGFAVLKMDDYGVMSSMVRVMKEEAQLQILKLKEQIKIMKG